jgi:hypothetical protein
MRLLERKLGISMKAGSGNFVMGGMFAILAAMDESDQKPPVLEYGGGATPEERGGIDGRVVLLGMLVVAIVLGAVIWVLTRLWGG